MSQDTTLERRRGMGWKAAWWLCLIVGGVATLDGLFILFGPEDEYVGVGGDLAWRVGDISSAWMFGLLIVGIGLLAGWLAMIVAGRRMGPVETTPRGEFLFHAGAFIIVNAYLWIQDFAVGSGLDYAYVTTVLWGIGLAFHAWQALRG
jgi:hypothetical protein